MRITGSNLDWHWQQLGCFKLLCGAGNMRCFLGATRWSVIQKVNSSLPGEPIRRGGHVMECCKSPCPKVLLVDIRVRVALLLLLRLGQKRCVDKFMVQRSTFMSWWAVARWQKISLKKVNTGAIYFADNGRVPKCNTQIWEQV